MEDNRKQRSDTERLIGQISHNHQSRQVIHLREPVMTDSIEVRLVAPSAQVPAALFAVRCYAQA